MSFLFESFYFILNKAFIMCGWGGSTFMSSPPKKEEKVKHTRTTYDRLYRFADSELPYYIIMMADDHRRIASVIIAQQLLLRAHSHQPLPAQYNQDTARTASESESKNGHQQQLGEMRNRQHRYTHIAG